MPIGSEMPLVPTTDGHVPVLLQETLDLLRVVPGGVYCDATAGAGGHSREILRRSAPDGRLLALDRDPEAVAYCTAGLSEFGDRVVCRCANYAEVGEVAGQVDAGPFDGIMADLGLSSRQLSAAARGFSFSEDGPLDMRMNATDGPTAAALISGTSEDALGQLIREYGEERYARSIARAIKRADKAGQLHTTHDLRDIVASAVPGKQRRQRIHPATRTFQALRIAVNDELKSLETFLDTVIDLLKPGGVVAVIAFHSLEDRIVKRRFRALAGKRERDGVGALQPHDPPKVSLLTKKPLRPSDEEVSRNPRARSARLRAAEKLPC